jgi:2-methylcitrate dehydratase PrpD
MDASLKRWTVGYPIQGVLDAAEALLKKQPINPENVQEMTISGAPGSITDNSGAGDINTQYAVALMLVKKTASFKDIHDWELMKDPAIVRLRAVTKLVPGQGGRGAAGGPPPPIIQITLKDGTKLTQGSAGPLLGSAGNPMSRAQLVAKCQDLMAPVLGAATSTKLINTVLELEKMKDIRELRPMLQVAYSSAKPKLSEYPSNL